MYIDYRNMCINEKMGVISRVFQEKDIFNVSKIANDFLSKISKDPNEQFEYVYDILTYSIKIKYIPNTNKKENGKTNGQTIFLYTYANKENYFKAKYTLIHELLHIIQIWYEDEYDNMSHIERIKYYFRKPYLSKLSTLSPQSKYRKFIYLLYREDMYEIYAWAHDAYMYAFVCKFNNQHLSNQEIVNKVLDKIFVNQNNLLSIIQNIKSSKLAYKLIIEILVSHFSELDGNNGQRFFDKSIFELDIVKKLRNDVKQILKTVYEPTDIVKEIKELIKTYNTQLLTVKKQIINSYINHLKYWYDKALKQYGKAIQLGIDDATIKNNKNKYK